MSNPPHESAVDRSGLPWPDAYADLLPALKQAWGIEHELYLTRRFSGKSGALVFAADIASRDFTGQAILKLDRAPDPTWRERDEAERHRLAFAAAPAFAARHLPRLLHTLHHDSHLAILSSIAGRGLEYSLPWHLCAYDRQLESIRRVSGELLEEWNRDYQLAEGIHEPQSLLESWLGYRLDPAESRIHGFLADACGLAPDEPSVSFEGHWYPNPLAFAARALELPQSVRLRAVRGLQHGDFHGFNLLIGSAPGTESDYFLIDLAAYENDQFLFLDHALFELNYLLLGREHVDDAHWESILDHLSFFRHHEGAEGLRGDDVGLVELVRALRRALLDWVDRHESNRLSYMESQYLLARVAAGLNFANKPISERSRRKAFLYAAANLKDYLKIHDARWPKHGPAFSLHEGAREDEAMHERPDRGVRPDAAYTNPSLPDKPAIAVLAFENLSGDPEQDYFADGISLEILTALSRVDWLMVISSGSTFAYKGQAVDPKRVARELGVHYVVEGDVRKSGNRVRITARLVDGRSGHTIRVDRYERDLADVFALEDEIAQSIASNVDTELKATERKAAHRRQGSLSVWDRFQKGLWHFFKYTDEDTETAREHMIRLTQAAPEFALSYAVLAFIDTRRIWFGEVEDREQVLAGALENATRAVSLDETSSLAHMALGRVYTQLADHEQAIAECETAVALNPSSAVAYASLAAALFSSGRAAEALAPLERSIRLSPKGPTLPAKLVGKAWMLYSLGRFAEARRMATHVPPRGQTGVYRWLLLAAIDAHEDRIEAAEAAAAKALEMRANVSVEMFRRSWQHLSPAYLDAIVADLEKAGLPLRSRT
ncbi:MAG: BTAD domain-containing putative transcriptional regulator [Gammaproteobacteria bacterium]|nr:BTAD domain-containing putative transcriptional regulator [Gammaproteobacteria bacterium]